MKIKRQFSYFPDIPLNLFAYENSFKIIRESEGNYIDRIHNSLGLRNGVNAELLENKLKNEKGKTAGPDIWSEE